MARNIELTRHENERFVSQTVFASGHAYINCEFDRCTIVVTNTPLVLDGNRFVGCNWRIEWDVLWGDPETRNALRNLLDAIGGEEAAG